MTTFPTCENCGGPSHRRRERPWLVKLPNKRRARRVGPLCCGLCAITLEAERNRETHARFMADRAVARWEEAQVAKLLVVTLGSVPNPDFGQTATHWIAYRNVPVADLREAREVCLAFIAEHNLGGGNWSVLCGCVSVPETVDFDSAYFEHFVARVSYNGRVWDANGVEVSL